MEFVLTPKIVAVAHKLCVDIAREWQILLIGKETENGMVCYDYYIPKQETGLATVKNNDEITLEVVKQKKIVGTMHSHNEMAVSFSGVDDQCTNHSFIKNHIVTNNKHDFLAVSRIELPCGLIKFVRANVITQVPKVNKVKGIENIEERKFQTYTGYTCYNKGGYYGDTNGFGTSHLPAHYQPTVDDKDIKWVKGNRRPHAFSFDQKGYGGCYGF